MKYINLFLFSLVKSNTDNIVLYSKNKYVYELDTNLNCEKSIKFKEIYKPKTDKQNIYYKDINNENIDLVIAYGPAGSGKTLLPTQHIAKLLKTTDKKIVLTRPLISVDEELGYLPGNINKKMDPWVIPIFDALREFFSQKDINNFIINKQIEIVPLAFMRGRTFKNTFIIADELQNTSNKQMLMLLTRLGKDSKIVITGDINQCDNDENGLLDLLNKIKKKNLTDKSLREKSISLIKLTNNDIQRSRLVNNILDIYSD